MLPAVAPRRLCYFAHYDPDAIVAEHVLSYLGALRGCGFEIVFGTPCRLADTERDKLAPFTSAIVERENFGMDFGTWIDLIDHHPPGDRDLVLLCNDSVYAPIGSLDKFLDKLLSVRVDFYGAIASGEVQPHLQSWFMLFRPSAHRSEAFRRLMTKGSITADTSKTDIIDRYEMGMTANLVAQGLTYHAAYDWQRDSHVARSVPFNPAHLLWDELVAGSGIPFIKIELLRYNPASVSNIDDWRGLIAARNPDLMPLIDADLARRKGIGKAVPIVRPKSRTRLNGAPDPVYRPSLRRFLVRDYRLTARARRVSGLLNAVALRFARQYFRIGRIVKWSVLPAPPTDRP